LKLKRIIPIVVIGAVAIVAVVKSGWLRRDDKSRIRISGNIELTEVDVAFKTPGKLVELKVDEGDRVKAGQLVARIDPQMVEQQRIRDQAGVLSAQTQLTQLRTSISYQRASLNSDVDLRKAELRQAEAHLAELLAGSRTQEIEQARQRVEELKVQVDQAQTDWDRAQTLFKGDDISRQQYDQYRTRWETTTASFKQAQQALALVKEGPRKEQIEAARAQVERAGAAVKFSEAAAIDLRRREEEIQTREAEIDRAKAQLGMSQTQVEDTVARAPVDGVVLVKPIDNGEVVAAGTPVVTIGNLAKPWLRGYVKETDLGRVKVGEKVRVTTDSYPGKEYWGRVTFVASEAEFTPKQIQTTEERVKLVYRIKVELDNPNYELKSNMPVDGEIQVNQ
jgi:HlyD family secretion protein